MDTDTLIRAISRAGYEARPYAGRGMYGRQCVGVEVGRHGTFGLGVGLALALGEEAADLDALTDGMGMGVVVYFPKVWWKGRDESRDEDDE